jgi:hypothetical protein
VHAAIAPSGLYEAGLIAQLLNAKVLSWVPLQEHRFAGQFLFEPPAHIASTCSAEAR